MATLYNQETVYTLSNSFIRTSYNNSELDLHVTVIIRTLNVHIIRLPIPFKLKGSPMLLNGFIVHFTAPNFLLLIL